MEDIANDEQEPTAPGPARTTTITNKATQYPPPRPGKPPSVPLSVDQRVQVLEKDLAELKAKLKKKIANL